MSQSITRLGNISSFPPQFLSSTSNAWICNKPYLRQPTQTEGKDLLSPSLNNSPTNCRKLTQLHRINIYSVEREDLPCALQTPTSQTWGTPHFGSENNSTPISNRSNLHLIRARCTFIGTSQCLLSRDSLVAP